MMLKIRNNADNRNNPYRETEIRKNMCLKGNNAVIAYTLVKTENYKQKKAAITHSFWELYDSCPIAGRFRLYLLSLAKL